MNVAKKKKKLYIVVNACRYFILYYEQFTDFCENSSRWRYNKDKSPTFCWVVFQVYGLFQHQNLKIHWSTKLREFSDWSITSRTTGQIVMKFGMNIGRYNANKIPIQQL